MVGNLYIVSENSGDTESWNIFYAEYFKTKKEAQKRVAELKCSCDNPEDCYYCHKEWFVLKAEFGKH